jgi:hypothetical protein
MDASAWVGRRLIGGRWSLVARVLARFVQTPPGLLVFGGKMHDLEPAHDENRDLSPWRRFVLLLKQEQPAPHLRTTLTLASW